MVLGNGNGTFQTAPLSYTFGGSDFAVADFNSDGKPDLASLDAELPLLSVRLGNGTGWFRTAPVYEIPQTVVYNDARAIATADFNNDSKPDMAAPSSLRPGAGNGTFQAAIPINGMESATSLSTAQHK